MSRASDRIKMGRVTLHDLDQAVIIEVDGDLDSVAGHDLREVLSVALRVSSGVIELDLSRVASVDDQGVASLRWCSDQAIGARRALVWSRCSQPLVRELRSSVAVGIFARASPE